MIPDHLEALSALFDGEPIDPALLAECLAEPDAARLLADFASLRVLAQTDLGRPTDAFYASMAAVLKGGGLRRLWHRVVRPALAASLLLAAGLAGFWLRPVLDHPKTTAKMIERAGTAGATATRATVPPAAAAPSSPSRAVSARVLDPGGPPAPALRLRFAQWHTLNPSTGRPSE
jgi:hypothetical protein